MSRQQNTDGIAIVGQQLTGGEAKHQTRAKRSRDLMDLAFAKRVSAVLQRHYPNYRWRVEADTRAKLIKVQNIDLSGSWGFVLHMTKISCDTDLERKVMRAGGETLERYGLQALGFNANEYALLQKNSVGEFGFQE